MSTIYQKFYKNFYRRTGGFIPTKPLNLTVLPGDFFQIKNGEMIVLGNIFRNGVVDPINVDFGNGIRLNPAGWDFSEGVSKPYSGRGVGLGAIDGQFEFSKQVLAFGTKGSYFFRGNNPETVKILNWNTLQPELIIKLTQTYYSFREVYLVTECATTSDWTLAIAGADNAELEIATDSDNFGLGDIFGHHSAKTIQSRDIELYIREPERKPSFFKASKLTTQDEKLNTFVNALIYQRMHQQEWAENFYNYKFQTDTIYNANNTAGVQASVIDMLQANDLNPVTALRYFKWMDANMDDIEQLFIRYGNE